jgi:hypothetical protein
MSNATEQRRRWLDYASIGIWFQAIMKIILWWYIGTNLAYSLERSWIVSKAHKKALDDLA